tara:strand:+ start:5198 stop:5431 length:234 start_codon:yes stop_codon:yes gene_type:complete
MDIERRIKQLKSDQKLVDQSINRNKLKFINEIRDGLGEKIINEINKPIKKKEVEEEKEQSKGLFRKMKIWISSLSQK